MTTILYWCYVLSVFAAAALAGMLLGLKAKRRWDCDMIIFAWFMITVLVASATFSVTKLIGESHGDVIKFMFAILVGLAAIATILFIRRRTFQAESL